MEKKLSLLASSSNGIPASCEPGSLPVVLIRNKLNRVLLILNQSQKEMSIIVGETKVIFESLSQLAQKKKKKKKNPIHPSPQLISQKFTSNVNCI